MTNAGKQIKSINLLGKLTGDLDSEIYSWLHIEIHANLLCKLRVDLAYELWRETGGKLANDLLDHYND